MSVTVPQGVQFDASGLVPVVVQDRASGDVLMVAWANAEALDLTARIGQHFAVLVGDQLGHVAGIDDGHFRAEWQRAMRSCHLAGFHRDRDTHAERESAPVHRPGVRRARGAHQGGVV
jgi:hypothetical protein